MSLQTKISQLYKPLQPVVKQFDDGISYQEFSPDFYLKEFIHCYWELKSTEKLSKQFNYKVVADGCMDIFFELSNPKNSFVMGFCNKYEEFALDETFNYIGIRFLPAMLPQLLKINAFELSNVCVELDNINHQVSNFLKNSFHPHLKIEEVKNLLDNYFLKHIYKAKFTADHRLYEAIELIITDPRLNKNLDTGISRRQLQRLFNQYIGDTPKAFSKVIRFQHILKAQLSAQNLEPDKLFYSAGYYDQAHFIKEFKNFYGQTPGKILVR